MLIVIAPFMAEKRVAGTAEGPSGYHYVYICNCIIFMINTMIMMITGLFN